MATDIEADLVMHLHFGLDLSANLRAGNEKIIFVYFFLKDTGENTINTILEMSFDGSS